MFTVSLDVIYETLHKCVSFGIAIKIRTFLKGHGDIKEWEKEHHCFSSFKNSFHLVSAFIDWIFDFLSFLRSFIF